MSTLEYLNGILDEIATKKGATRSQLKQPHIPDRFDFANDRLDRIQEMSWRHQEHMLSYGAYSGNRNPLRDRLRSSRPRVF